MSEALLMNVIDSPCIEVARFCSFLPRPSQLDNAKSEPYRMAACAATVEISPSVTGCTAGQAMLQPASPALSAAKFSRRQGLRIHWSPDTFQHHIHRRKASPDKAFRASIHQVSQYFLTRHKMTLTGCSIEGALQDVVF